MEWRIRKKKKKKKKRKNTNNASHSCALLKMGSWLLLLPEVVFDLNRRKWAAAHFNHPFISLMPPYYQCSKQKILYFLFHDHRI
jgi:hypothetical protein